MFKAEEPLNAGCYCFRKQITAETKLEGVKIVVEKYPVGRLFHHVLVLGKNISKWNTFFTNEI